MKFQYATVIVLVLVLFVTKSVASGESSSTIPVCDTCGKYIPGRCEEGSFCGKESRYDIDTKCLKRVGDGEDCSAPCTKCTRGTKCVEGVCVAINKEGIECGKSCENREGECRTGLTCTDVGTLGKFCSKFVGQGESCNLRCRLCQKGFSCNSYSKQCEPDY